MLTASSSPLPGIYPLISHFDPAQKLTGKDNLGMGYTQHGEQFLLKKPGMLGAAEFIGAKVCDACGIPACQPTIVTLPGLNGDSQVFGSRIESGVHKFAQGNIAEWRSVLAQCSNPAIFSAMLAIDLVLGNDDRHWNNWIVQLITTPAGTQQYRLRALDFSRAWPTIHPAHHPLQHHSKNTWDACKEWQVLGVSFEASAFYAACVKMGMLNAKWLRHSVLHTIEGVFITKKEADALCQWWEQHLRQQVIEVINSLEYGVRP